MAQLWLQAYLRHILLNLLPSPEISLISRQLHIANHLDIICDSLWAMNAIIMDANLRAIREPELKKWLSDVNTAIMKVENILEVIQDYCQQLKEQKQEVTPPSNLLHHYSTSISTLFLSSRRRAILVDLKQIARRVNCLLSRATAFGLVIDMIDSMNPNHDDYYSILREELVERDDDINRILQKIFRLQEGQPLCHGNDDVPFVVAIVGDSRMGKSILARMIYHHPLVCQFFKHRIWVDVSDCSFFSFAHRLVARECIRHLTGRIPSDINIWSLLRMSLPKTRYLIVLDGFEEITMADKKKWEELKKNLLSLSAPGSRVIATCQDYNIIEDDQIVDSDQVYRLHDITQNAKIKIFFKYLISRMQPDHSKQNFSSSGMTDMPDLANLQVVPFSTPDEARIFGSILAHLKGSYEQLQTVEHFGPKSMIMHSISHSRTQFLRYIVLFRPLPLSFIKDWFDMLITEGTFAYARKSQQEFERNISKLTECYQNEQIFNHIHSEFCKDVHHVRMRSGQKSRIPQRCRYLCMVIESHTGKFSAKLPNNLRALILYKVKRETNLHREKDQVALSVKIPKSLVKSLVILRIINIGIHQLLNTIGTLLHLRYLNISEKEIQVLPKSICDLYNLCVLSLSHCKKLQKLPKHIYKLGNLQKLKLDYCTKLQKMPDSITRLQNLRVLDVEACYWLSELPKDLRHLERLMNLNMTGCASLTRMPIGISKLTNLEALSGYIVDDYDHETLTLQELQPLVNIEQLHVQHLERVLDLNAIKSVNLKEKQYLENLLLHWEWWNMNVRTDDQLESLQILEALQPNFLYLAKLDVIFYMGMQFPNWMMTTEQLLLFKYLVEIRLVNIKRCNNLPLLCLLPSLASLEISGMDSLSYLGNNIMPEDVHTFPNLVKLTLSEMPSLIEWNFSCPCLQNLILMHCPKLMRLCGFEVKIKLTIWLQSTILGQYSTSFQYIFKNIEELEIFGCHELRWLPEDIMHCENLQTLSIIRCSKLHSLPDWLEKMSSLKKITVLGCRTISHISEKLKLRLKDHIVIQGCHKRQAVTRRDKHL